MRNKLSVGVTTIPLPVLYVHIPYFIYNVTSLVPRPSTSNQKEKGTGNTTSHAPILPILVSYPDSNDIFPSKLLSQYHSYNCNIRLVPRIPLDVAPASIYQSLLSLSARMLPASPSGLPEDLGTELPNFLTLVGGYQRVFSLVVPGPLSHHIHLLHRGGQREVER